VEAACTGKSGVKYFYATQELIQHLLAPGSGYEGISALTKRGKKDIDMFYRFSKSLRQYFFHYFRVTPLYLHVRLGS
jgi:hypothetical protein